MERFATNTARTVLQFLRQRVRTLVGSDSSEKAGRLSRIGLALAGFFLIFSGLWIIYFLVGPVRLLPIGLVFFGIYCLASSRNVELSLPRANLLALSGHLTALLAYYFFSSRFLTVVYSTDSIVGTYMGIVKSLQGQNPYFYSIKPFLDQFNFPPSLYTPRVDGSFEFHLNYPALNFLLLIPFYAAGVRDIRDQILLFHVACLVLLFYVAPAKWKTVGIAPFALGLPSSIVTSWTDSVWAFFLLLSAVYWYKGRKGLSFMLVGLAGATKQIALVAAPFMLVRMWHETEGARTVKLVKSAGLMLAGFLVPNLPFILISPSAWWKGTIGPYLPETTPLVSGGIGLSEVLTDMGAGLSPSFYTLLTGVVGGLLLLLYSFRFEKLRKYMWAMPAVLLYFYPRAFPNYLVFWLFPLIPELMLYKSSGLGWRLPSLRIPDWTLTGRIRLGGWRGRMVSVLMVVLVLTTVLVGASGVYFSRPAAPRVEVRVDSLADPDSLGVATRAIVTLNNTGDRPVKPEFFLKPGFLPFLWTSNSSLPLLSGTAAHYLLNATDALAAIPPGTLFRFQVFDSATGQLAGQSRMSPAEVAVPEVGNPDFKWWTIDQSTARKVPFGWKLRVTGVDPASSGLRGLDAGSTHGVEFWLNTTGINAGLGEVAVSQRMLFNTTRLDVFVFHGFPTGVTAGTVFGARFTDGLHLLYFLFSDKVPQKSVSVFAENTTVTVPVVFSAWSWVRVDAESEWTALGWAPSPSLDCSFFLESPSPGVYSSSLLEVTEARLP